MRDVNRGLTPCVCLVFFCMPLSKHNVPSAETYMLCCSHAVASAQVENVINIDAIMSAVGPDCALVGADFLARQLRARTQQTNLARASIHTLMRIHSVFMRRANRHKFPHARWRLPAGELGRRERRAEPLKNR